MNEKPNFILIQLGDNDFGQQLEEASRRVFDHAKCFREFPNATWFSDRVVALVLALDYLRVGPIDPNKSWRLSVEKYINSALLVTYEHRLNSMDHDGGSVWIDTHTERIWRF